MNFIEKVYKVIKNKVLLLKYKKCKVISADDTLDLILAKKLSVGRFGDGELDIMDGRFIGFQSPNIELGNRLAEVKNKDNFLVCIPNIFNKRACNRKNIEDKEYVMWTKNKMLHENLWRKYFGESVQGVCGDAFISRFYMRYKDKSKVGEYVEKFKKLWDNRKILIVEGEKSQLGVGNDLLDNAKEIKRILCPAKNAFDVYDEILTKVKEHAKNFDITIIALGPTATVLAYDLSREGIWALDLGHFDIEYEWFKMGVDHKVPVKGKHVNECNADGERNEQDQKYNNEIILRIGIEKN